MSDPGALSEAAIRKLVGPKSFGRGRRYFEDGHIERPRRTGPTLTADCVGSESHPYRVEVTLQPEGLQGGTCTCPVAWNCKHVAALLLTWLHQPDAFVEEAPLEERLLAMGHEDLAQLVLRLVERHYDLRDLVEAQLGLTPAEHGTDLDLGPAQRLIGDAARRIEHADEDSDLWSAIGDWAAVVSQADDLAERGHVEEATQLYAGVAAAVVEVYEQIWEHEGEPDELVQRCTEGLAESLETLRDAALRSDILRALWDIADGDAELGGMGLGDDAWELLMALESPDERRTIAGWAREALTTTAGTSDWRRAALAGFVLQLDDALDADGALELCRATGRYGDLVDRLLAAGRVDEAVAVVRDYPHHNVLPLLETLVADGHGEQADQLARDRLEADGRDWHLTDWLLQRRRSAGDLDEALRLTRRLFDASGSIRLYPSLRELAQEANCWEALQAQLREGLEAEGKLRQLTEMLLADGELDAAMEALAAHERLLRYPDPGLRRQVAEALKVERPEQAIPLLLDQAEGHVGGRNRSAYRRAAEVLLEIRELEAKVGGDSAVMALIADWRVSHATLRALWDELAKHGLT